MSASESTAHSTMPGRRFTDGDAHVLEIFGDVAMLALSHFSMHDELRALNNRLERRVRERTAALGQSSREISRKNEQRHRGFTQPESEMDMSRRLIFRPAQDRTFLRTAALRPGAAGHREKRLAARDVREVRELDCESAPKWGSDAILVQLLLRAD